MSRAAVVFLLLAVGASSTSAAQVAVDSVRRTPVTRAVRVDSVTVFRTRSSVRVDTLRLRDTLRLAVDSAAVDTMRWGTEGRTDSLRVRWRRAAMVTDSTRVYRTAPSVVTATPFGPFAAWIGPRYKAHLAGFTLTGPSADNPDTLLLRLDAAKQAGRSMVLALTGGGPHNYTTDGVFDLAKWLARLRRYDTPAIREGIAAAVERGTVLGYSMVDEPHHRNWGEWFTKPRLDAMADSVRAIFPTLPVGVVVRPDWRTHERFQRLDFIVAQYWERIWGPDVARFRDLALAVCTANGVSCLFSVNVIDGGPPLAGCPRPQTGGAGSFGGNCRMSSARVREAGILLGSAGCGLLMWEYATDMMADPAYQQTFREVAAAISGRRPAPCRRTRP